MTEYEKLSERINQLPIGYVSRKRINDKEYFYLQWKEEGKSNCRILRPDEVDDIKAQVEERKALT